jgi:hypothetical protein
MAKKNLRQQYINDIMENKYGDDDPKHYDSNLDFLNGLSLEELASMASNEFEDEEFELEGEV